MNNEIQQLLNELEQEIKLNNNELKNTFEIFDNYDDYILVETEFGGISGGSCWNDDQEGDFLEEYEMTQEEIHDQIKCHLSDLLQKLLTHLKINEANFYKKIKPLIVSINMFEYESLNYIKEHYGNSQTNALYKVKLSDIVNICCIE